MLAGGAVVAAAPIAHASAVSAFRDHYAFLSMALVYHNLGGCGGGNVTAVTYEMDKFYYVGRTEKVLPAKKSASVFL